MSKNIPHYYLSEAHNDVCAIYSAHTQDTLASHPNPDPILHLVDAVLTLATVIHAGNGE